MAKDIYQTPTGMHDLFAIDIDLLEKIENNARKIADFYGFERFEPPLLEFTHLFEKGTGEFTDIVEKEMYNLKTKGGDLLTLRPEYTPSIARAYIQHGMQNLPKPVKLWYCGPVFRHERPQAGRFRQFHQLGFEALGSEQAVLDAMIVQMFTALLQTIGVKKILVQVNCIGDSQCRPAFRKSLVGYFRARSASLCPTCKTRLKKNPLRILDCKEEKCEKIKKGAPQILDYLCKECHNHFKSFLEILEELEIPYALNPYLVRGLDYYTKTVFEIEEDSEAGKMQGALVGGGRYDGLIKLLGGKDTPAVGGALGAERVIGLLKNRMSKKPTPEQTVKIFLAQVGELARRKALKLFEMLRQANLQVGEALHKDSLSAQLKMADKACAQYTLIIGQREALDNQVIIREMKSGRQKIVDMDKVVKELKNNI